MGYDKKSTAKITEEMNNFLVEVAENTDSTESHIMRNILITYLDLYQQYPKKVLSILGEDYENDGICNKYITTKINEKMDNFLTFAAEKTKKTKSEIIRNILITYIDLYRKQSKKVLNILKNHKK